MVGGANEKMVFPEESVKSMPPDAFLEAVRPELVFRE
jgi:hypothetical protein